MLNAQAVVKAIMEWPGRYEDENGNIFEGMPVSQVPSQLRDCRWRNVSHLDASDFRKMGLEIVTARYVGGVKKKRFCRVVVAKQYTPADLEAQRLASHLKDVAMDIAFDAVDILMAIGYNGDDARSFVEKSMGHQYYQYF